MYGLQDLTVDALAAGLQHRSGNPIAGLEGRAQLLINLGDALAYNRDFFGEDGRPGNMLGTSLRGTGARGSEGGPTLTWPQTICSPTRPRRRHPRWSWSYRCFGTC